MIWLSKDRNTIVLKEITVSKDEQQSQCLEFFLLSGVMPFDTCYNIADNLSTDPC